MLKVLRFVLLLVLFATRPLLGQQPTPSPCAACQRVPEPSSFVLIGSAVAVLGCVLLVARKRLLSKR